MKKTCTLFIFMLFILSSCNYTSVIPEEGIYTCDNPLMQVNFGTQEEVTGGYKGTITIDDDVLNVFWSTTNWGGCCHTRVFVYKSRRVHKWRRLFFSC